MSNDVKSNFPQRAHKASPEMRSILRVSSWRKIRSNILIYAALIVLLVLFLFPLYWLVGLSFKTRAQIFANPPLWAWEPTLDNYKAVLGMVIGDGALQGTNTGDFLKFFTNSLVVSISSVLLSLIVGVPAGYAFARFKFFGSGAMFFGLLLMRMLPPIAVLLPMYVLLRQFGLLDTYLGLSLAYTTFSLPLVVWIMRGFFEGLPKELEESAMMDGCSRFGTFWRIILPLTRPGIVAATIFSVALSWNDFLFAVVLTTRKTQTLPVMMAGYSSDVGIAWGEMTAAAVLVILPVIVFSILTQKHLVTGLSGGAVKG